MNLNEAKKLRDKNLHMVGQKAKNRDANIYDVIVAPDSNLGAFINQYRMYSDDMNNDEMLMNFPSPTYRVVLVYDIDPELVDITWEEISSYLQNN
jgi:hypothetical protein